MIPIEDIHARVDQATGYLKQMGGAIAAVYEVLTDPLRDRVMPEEHAAVSATQLVLSAMEMASWST